MLICARSLGPASPPPAADLAGQGLAEGTDPGSDNESIMLIPSLFPGFRNRDTGKRLPACLRVSHRYRAVPKMLRKR